MINLSGFDPEKICDRAAAVTYIWHALGSPAAKSVSYTDVDTNVYFAPALAWATEKGLVSGTGGGAFAPYAPCTQAQIMTLLYRAYR